MAMYLESMYYEERHSKDNLDFITDRALLSIVIRTIYPLTGQVQAEYPTWLVTARDWLESCPLR